MAAQRDRTGTRPKVKEEVLMDSWRAGEPNYVNEYGRTSEHVAHLRRTARDMAAAAGFDSPGLEARTGIGGNCDQLQVKTPKYSGKANWEAYHAQFELLAQAAGWSGKKKALQLAMCLTEEALTCLLLLSPAERADYGALVGALQRRFGQCCQPGVLRSELSSRQRQPGEPLRVLANDIETLARRAYAHMPAEVQCELARDQFIRAITPRELRIQTQLAHPCTLQEALELALEREVVGGASESDFNGGSHVVRSVVQEGPGQEKPAWVAELTEMIRAVSLQSPHSNTRPRRGAPVCWVCGQAGHISVRCPKRIDVQGNDPGSV